MGLWKYLSQYLKPINIKEYENQTCGLDAHFFFHSSKGKLGLKILEEIPDFTPIYKYLIDRILLLKKKYNINSIVVLEGNSPPIREKIQNKRDESKDNYLKKANEFIEEKKYYKAMKCKKNSIHLKPIFYKDFYEMCIEKNIECIISPYSSDYQLRYLEKINKIDFVIGCDSDLITLGCKNILYDFDLKNFKGGFRYNKEEFQNIFLEKNFTEEKFLIKCLFMENKFFFTLSQYNLEIATKILEEENEIDLKKIYKEFKFHKESPLETKIINFEKSYIAYKYGIIYCPLEHKGKYLNELPTDKNHFVYKYNLDEIVGEIKPPEIMEGIACGKINAVTYEEMKESLKPTHDFMNMLKKEKELKKNENKEEDKKREKFKRKNNQNLSKPFFYNSKKNYNNDLILKENLPPKPFFFNSKLNEKKNK